MAPRSRILALLTAAIGLLHPVVAVAAEFPKIDTPGSEGWISLVVAIVLLIAVGFASFINPKRSHRD